MAGRHPVISSPFRSEAYQRRLSCPHSLHLSFKDHSNYVQTCVNIHFILINSPDCFNCLFSWYGLLITVGGVGGDFSQIHFVTAVILKHDGYEGCDY